MVQFEEIQQVSKSLRMILAILCTACLFLAFYVNEAYIIGTTICFVFLTICFTIKFEVRINNNRIEYKLFPIHKINKIVSLNSIEKMEIITPVQRGILGIKIKNTPSGSFYYFGGNSIMCLRTIEGKTIYIGTRKIEELEKILNRVLDRQD